MFKWICLGLAVAAAVVLGWMINDVRLEVKQSVTVVNEKLPEIIANTKKSTDTLAELSGDVEKIKDLAGMHSGAARDEGLVAYADGVLDLIDAQGGEIGLKKKIFGSGLKELVPTSEWVTGARKEALWLTLVSRSRRQIALGLCRNKFGSDFYLQKAEEEPVILLQWLMENDPQTAQLNWDQEE